MLETSLHVDKMLALSSGSQYKDMIETNNTMTERITKALASVGIASMEELYSSTEKAAPDEHNSSNGMEGLDLEAF